MSRSGILVLKMTEISFFFFLSRVENISLFQVAVCLTGKMFLPHWQVLNRVKRSYLISHIFVIFSKKVKQI